MSQPIISAEGLGKCYRVGRQSASRESYTALRDVLARSTRELFRKTRDLFSGHQIVQGDVVEDFWALRDLSFEIQPGEVLGIIGRNGAGKSTLLKILSRITEPTEGRVTVRGRVASLLEVGTGFHPELSGRENIFLNGAILGMTRVEIKRKFDEIVDFAGVEKFLDTPVKRFSSGMYVRLAFAVAAHLDPEILVVDEVLAVGDAEFQRKCLGKMGEVARGGRTVVFVSHNTSAILSLCKSAILLDQGRLIATGEVPTLLAQYRKQSEPGKSNLPHSITKTLRLTAFKFSPDVLEGSSEITFHVRIESDEPQIFTDLSILLISPREERVGICDLRPLVKQLREPAATSVIEATGRLTLPEMVESTYSLGIYLGCTGFHGNLFDLTSLQITEPPRDSIAPYPAASRGMIVLNLT